MNWLNEYQWLTEPNPNWGLKIAYSIWVWKPEKTLISGMVPGIIVKKIPIPPTFILIKFY